LTTWTNCCCRASADGEASTAGVAADELVPALVVEQPASTSAAVGAATATRSRRRPPPLPRRRLRMRIMPAAFVR
jgi:hypothetical protein